MDFGIDRLIEMFEERFGQRASTVLLALIGLGAAGLAIHSIVFNMMEPSIKFGLNIYHAIQGVHFGPPAQYWHWDSFPLPVWVVYCYGLFAAFFGLYVMDRAISHLTGGRVRWALFLLKGSVRNHVARLEVENAELRAKLHDKH